MTNIKTGEIEFYTLLVRMPKRQPVLCCDDNGLLKFNSMKEAKCEAKRLNQKHNN
ncbi:MULTISPECIES: hypothetical protein [unclassified Pseudoalteromonas]|uniref:hypothetical protein n=1 Tax=unclassified Pseudoalteromonas TaxID=194690 RepID=UPI001EF020C5|nr:MULTISPECIES: hypothetical protein [unclassified Pseudoalteromonas]